MAESGQTEGQPKFSGELRKRYEPVRPIVKETLKEELTQNPTADRQTVQRSAFRAADKLSPLVYRDKLTGLYNKRWFDDELKRRLAIINRGNQEKQLGFTTRDFKDTQESTDAVNRVKKKRTFLILQDIDKFKQINDGFGHGTGNKILESIANAPARTEEPVARIGGEEFIGLVDIENDISPEEIEQRLQTIVQRHTDHIGNHSVTILRDAQRKDDYRGSLQERVTLSYGITELLPGDTPEIAFNRADVALYKAKQERNKAVIARASFVTDKEENLSFQDIYNGPRQAV